MIGGTVSVGGLPCRKFVARGDAEYAEEVRELWVAENPPVDIKAYFDRVVKPGLDPAWLKIYESHGPLRRGLVMKSVTTTEPAIAATTAAEGQPAVRSIPGSGTAHRHVLVAVVNNRPQLLNLKQVLEYFLDYRREVIIRRSRFDLKKAQHRAHILEGLLKALANIDEVIRIIRKEEEPKPKLMQRFKLTDEQAEAILETKLRHLAKLEEMEIRAEDKALREELKKLLYMRPDYQLDPFFVAPPIIEYFESVRKEITGKDEEVLMEDFLRKLEAEDHERAG